MRKLVSFRRNVQMSIDRFPAQVLQGGQAAGQRSGEHQRDLLPSGGDVGHIPTLRHIVTNQLQYTVKVGGGRVVLRVCVQAKRTRVAMDAQVLGAQCRFDAEREQVPVVGAVPDEEGADVLGQQHRVGLLAGDGAPVEAALLELVERGEDHLVLRHGAESLVTLRQPHVGVQEAAAHCGVKLAVSYHGALPTLLAALGAPGATQTR